MAWGYIHRRTRTRLASERAGTSGTSGGATGDDDDDGDGAGSSGKKQGKTKGGKKARLGRNVYLKNRQQSFRGDIRTTVGVRWTQSGVVYHGQLLGQADSVIAPT